MEDGRNIPVYTEDNIKICHREKLFQTLGFFDLRQHSSLSLEFIEIWKLFEDLTEC